MSVDQEANKTRRVVAAGLAGNILEWYDFAVYGFFAPILAKLFFPSDDPTTSLIASYGAFAAGFLMRPVGAALFGHIGDRYGRKKALTLSVLMMAVPSLCIGLLPTYESLGVMAAVLLVVLRMLQGVAVGGEYTGSVVFLVEHAPAHRRGLFGSWALLGANCGILLGSLVGAVLTSTLSDAQLNSWGWRLPFIMGIVVAFTGFLIRRGVNETASDAPEGFPLLDMVRHHGRTVLHVFSLNVGYAVMYYIAFVFVAGWLVSEMHETKSEALTINTTSMIVMAFTIPAMAMVSDRIGRKPLMVAGAILWVLLPYPLVSLMHHGDPIYAQLGQLGFVVILSIFVAPLPAALAEMFPSEIRVTAVSVGYNVAFAIFGGTAPMVATWLISRTGDSMSFAWYISVMAIPTLIGAILVRESYRSALHKE